MLLSSCVYYLLHTEKECYEGHEPFYCQNSNWSGTWRVLCWRQPCCIMHSDFCRKCPAYLTATVQSLNSSRPHMGRRLMLTFRQTSHCRSYVPTLESVLSVMPVPLHGTQRNASELNRTFVPFRKLLKTHLFNQAFNVPWHSGFYSMWLLECTYVQYVIGALQMHWMMMMMILKLRLLKTTMTAIFKSEVKVTLLNMPILRINIVRILS